MRISQPLGRASIIVSSILLSTMLAPQIPAQRLERVPIAVKSRSDVVSGVCSTNTVVTRTADSGPGTLRGAIAAACDGSIITFNFAPPLSDAPSAAQQINLLSPLGIGKTLTIDGPGAAQLTVTRATGSNIRNFVISSGTVTISNLTVKNGLGNLFSSGP